MVAKRLSVDQVFKEGLGDYQAKPKHDLEKKMAAMIGIGGVAATGSAAASTAASAGAGAGAGTVSGVTSIATSGGLISKATALLKVIGIKSAAILKTLGIIKIIGTIVVVGTATTVAIVLSEEIKEPITTEKQSEIIAKTESSTKIDPLAASIVLNEKTKLLEAKDIVEKSSLLQETEESSQTNLTENKTETIEHEKTLTAPKSKDELTSAANQNTSTDKTIEKSTYKETLHIEEEIPLTELSSISLQKVRCFNRDASILNREMKLQIPYLEPPKMNSLEKGFYLPNYNITAGLYAMPITALQLYKNEFSNDSITSHQIAYHPQWSVQLGADIRIQKKRKPWFLQLGINYMNLKQEKELRFNQEYIDYGQSYWNFDSVYYYYINPPLLDSSLARVDSSYFEFWIRNNINQKSQETYHFISIPLQVGYEYQNYGKNWSLEAAAGISTSIILQGKGITYNSSGEIIDFSSGQLTPKLQFFAIGQLAFNYQLNKLTLFIKPTFKYQLSKINYDQSIEKNQFLILGTQLGVRFKLFENAGQP